MTRRALFRTFLVLGGFSFLVSCAEYPAPSTVTAPTPPPMGYWNGDGVPGSPKIVISIAEQHAYFYKGKNLVGESTVSTGKPGFSTPPGHYTVVWKDAEHVSTVFGDYVDDFGNVVKSNIDARKDRKPPGSHYDGARMPYAMFFRGGYAMHQGYVPPYAASHGCIRLPQGMAQPFFENAPLGTPVIVKAEAVLRSVPVPAPVLAANTVVPPAPTLVRSTAPASVPPAPVRTTVPAPSPIPLRSPAPVFSRAPVPVQSPAPMTLRSPDPLRYQAPTSVRPAPVRTTVPAPTPIPLRSPAPVLSRQPVPVQTPAPVTIRSPSPPPARYPAVTPIPLRSPSPASVRSRAPLSTSPTPAPVVSPTPSPVRSPAPVPAPSPVPASVQSTPAPVHSRKRHRYRSHKRVHSPAPSPTPGQ